MNVPAFAPHHHGADRRACPKFPLNRRYTLADKSCRQKLKTYYGMQSMHQLFERTTWHSAQHARQLVAVLGRFGIEPNVRLTAEDLAGLPLPERLWE